MKTLGGLFIGFGMGGVILFFLNTQGYFSNSEKQELTTPHTQESKPSFFSIEPNQEDKTLRILIGGNTTIWGESNAPSFPESITAVFALQDGFILNQKTLITDSNLNPETQGMSIETLKLLKSHHLSHLVFLDNALFQEGEFMFDLSQAYADKEKIQPLSSMSHTTISSHDFQAHVVAIHAGQINTAEYETLFKTLGEESPIITLIDFGEGNPETISSASQQLAWSLIRSGSDMVIGMGNNHILNAETFLDRPIFYSLGDFIADNETEGMMVEIILSAEIRKIYTHAIQSNPKKNKFTKWSLAEVQLYMNTDIARSFSSFFEGVDFNW